jgi:hypothetical protein
MTSEQYEKREFHTSSFSPFSGNMAFEIYRPTGASSPKPPKLRRRQDAGAAAVAPQGLIRLLVNEVPMLLPGCGSNYFCEWSTFKKVLQNAGAGCDFDACCASSSKPASASAPDSEARDAFLKAFGKRAEPVCLPVEPIA